MAPFVVHVGEGEMGGPTWIVEILHNPEPLEAPGEIEGSEDAMKSEGTGGF